MYFLLIIVSMILAFVGVTLLSQATVGVGVICLAVLVAIYARLAQANYFHYRERQALEDTLKRNN